MWSTIEMQRASEKGEWISYKVLYEGKADTLFVKNIAATKSYAFAGAFDGKFIHERWFVCRLSQNVLHIVDLETGIPQEIGNVQQYAVSGNEEYIIYTTDKGITVSSSQGRIKWKHDNVNSFSLNPSGTAMVCNAADTIFYISLKDKKVVSPKRIAGINGCNPTGFAWQVGGDSFAFGIKGEGDQAPPFTGVCLYKIDRDKLYKYELPKNVSPTGKQVAIDGESAHFRVSDDGTKVFFPITENKELFVKQNSVQVWGGNTPLTYGESQLYGSSEDTPKIMVWKPTTGQCTQLTSDKRDRMFLSGDQKYAISYSAEGNAPHFDCYQQTDYYITDLETNQAELFLEDQSTDQLEITASPDGKYIAYLKNGNWWIYIIAKGQHINISESFTSASKSKLVPPQANPTLDIIGWLSAGQGIVFNDGYDIWQLDLVTLKPERITQGRENKRIFRLVSPFNESEQKMNFDGFIFPEINPAGPYIVESFDVESKKYGYYKWKNKVLPILSKDKSLTQIIYSTKNHVAYYVEQDFDSPPAIMALFPDKKTRVIYKSNSQHDRFHWGHSRIINYTNSKGKQLQAGLYYPANFDPSEKYPMVVYIYEELSNKIHDYVNPSLHNYIGFNIANLTSKGYFVMCPDISYEIGDVGISAADCVISAVKSVMVTQGINRDKIALFGHSFGGYEAAFIATRTDLFTTIIAGAANTDMASAYLGISANSAQPNIWRFERQQWRMGKSLYQDQQGYQRNSTIHHAEKINTPILLFTGEKDGQVDMKQSMELYLALRRLGKQEIMLVYPGEGHVLIRQENQEDFTIRLEQWLDYFLKDDTSRDWIKEKL